MKRKILLCITLAALILVAFAFPAFAEIIARKKTGRRSLRFLPLGSTWLFTGTDGKPLAETEVFLQEDVDTEYLYNGVTDKDGKLSLPLRSHFGFSVGDQRPG